MATNDYDIANLALARLGQGTITSLAQAGRDAEVCNLYYAQNRDYCQVINDWSSLTDKVHLTRAGKTAVAGYIAGNPADVLLVNACYETGDLITIEDVVGTTQMNDGIFVVGAYVSIAVYLYDVEGNSVDGTGWNAWVSGGYVYRHPGNDWEYVYDLPSGCLKVLNLLDENFGESENYTWKRERNLLYCNMENAGVKYLGREPDVTRWDSYLVELMAARLAWLICPRISNDQTLRATLNQEWQAIAFKGYMDDSSGKMNDGIGEDLWVNAR